MSLASSSPRRHSVLAGRALSGLVVAFLLFDAVIHVLEIGPVVQSERAMGFAPGSMRPLGVLELVCIGLYLVPRTAHLGAVLLTGYLGGALSAQYRLSAPLFSTLLFPVYVGLMVWGGLWLRDASTRAVLPTRR